MVLPGRARLLVPLVGAAGLWAGAAGSVAGQAAPGPEPPAATVDHGAQAGVDSPKATDSRRKRRRRPGCGRFCRQAGGFGAPPEEIPDPVLIPRQQVRVARDGILTVRARCRLAKPCVGAILVDGRVSYGRADLRIPAGATRRVRVYVPARARRSLRRHRRDGRGFATVPLIYNDAPVSVSSTLTILAPR